MCLVLVLVADDIPTKFCTYVRVYRYICIYVEMYICIYVFIASRSALQETPGTSSFNHESDLGFRVRV